MNRSRIEAVLFDFGGTLYDYRTLAAAEQESLVELAEWAGVKADSAAIAQAYRQAMKRVFRDYLPRKFYLHRDLYRDALLEMLKIFGATATNDILERHRRNLWQRHARDFALREGVRETLGALRQRGLRLGLVSNIDEDQLSHLLQIAGVAPCFDCILSSEAARSCKPDREIFDEALRRCAAASRNALFVGDTIAQDIAGAKGAGLLSALLWHRDDRDPPAEGPQPDFVIRSFPDVVELVGRM